MASRFRALLGSIVLCFTSYGCAGSPAGSAAATPSAAAAGSTTESTTGSTTGSASAVAGETLGAPGLAIELAPQLAPRALRVRMVAHGKPAELTRWRLQVGKVEALSALRARDGGGAIGVRATAVGNAVELTLEREANSPVELSYVVAAATDVDARHEHAVAVNPERMRMAGESALALPVTFEAVGVEVKLDIVAKGLRGGGAASSFGVGATRRFKALGSELRKASYLAGAMGTAILDSREGHDEAAWLGFTTFDPRQAIGDFASFRTAVGNELGHRDVTPVTILMVSDQRPQGEISVVGRSASVLASFGVGQPFSGGLRISIATAIVQRWIGRVLWIGPTDGKSEAKAYWFSEGVARYVARELLMRFGLITPTEYATEVNRLLSVLATSELRHKTNDELAAALAEGSLPVIVARGALHASAVDHALRSNESTMLRVLRSLVAEAVKTRGTLPTSAWLDAIDAKLGKPGAAAKLHQTWVIDGGDGRARRLPATALGPCFRGKPRSYPIYALGFTEALSRNAVRSVTKVDPKGPAARAGLQDGDVLLRLRHRPGVIEHDVVATIVRDGKEKQVRYKPIGASRKGQGFDRLAHVDDARCIR